MLAGIKNFIQNFRDRMYAVQALRGGVQSNVQQEIDIPQPVFDRFANQLGDLGFAGTSERKLRIVFHVSSISVANDRLSSPSLDGQRVCARNCKFGSYFPQLRCAVAPLYVGETSGELCLTNEGLPCPEFIPKGCDR